MKKCSSPNRLQAFVPGNWNDFDSLLNQVLAPTVARAVHGIRAPLSAWEVDDAYHLELDVPGVEKEDIELTFEKGTLQIIAQRKNPEPHKGLHDERVYGAITRSIALSDAVDPESISAKLDRGVLHVTVAKVPAVQPKKIRIA